MPAGQQIDLVSALVPNRDVQQQAHQQPTDLDRGSADLPA